MNNKENGVSYLEKAQNFSLTVNSNSSSSKALLTDDKIDRGNFVNVRNKDYHNIYIDSVYLQNDSIRILVKNFDPRSYNVKLELLSHHRIQAQNIKINLGTNIVAYPYFENSDSITPYTIIIDHTDLADLNKYFYFIIKRDRVLSPTSFGVSQFLFNALHSLYQTKASSKYTYLLQISQQNSNFALPSYSTSIVIPDKNLKNFRLFAELNKIEFDASDLSKSTINLPLLERTFPNAFSVRSRAQTSALFFNTSLAPKGYFKTILSSENGLPLLVKITARSGAIVYVFCGTLEGNISFFKSSYILPIFGGIFSLNKRIDVCASYRVKGLPYSLNLPYDTIQEIYKQTSENNFIFKWIANEVINKNDYQYLPGNYKSLTKNGYYYFSVNPDKQELFYTSLPSSNLNISSTSIKSYKFLGFVMLSFFFIESLLLMRRIK